MNDDSNHIKNWLWGGLYGQGPVLRSILIASVFINLFVLTIPLFTMSVYDRVLPDFDEPTLIVLSTGVLIALFFDFLLKIIRGACLNALSAHLAMYQESRLMERFLQAPAGRTEPRTGEKLALFRELGNIRNFWTGRIIPFVVDAPFFLVFVVIIYILSPPLAFVPLGGAVVICGVHFLSSVFLRSWGNETLPTIRQKSSILLETLSGLPVVQAFDAQAERLEQWGGIIDAEQKAGKPEQFLQNLLSNLSVFITYGVTVFIMVAGAYQVAEGDLTLGGLIAVSILSSRALTPVTGTAQIFTGWRQYRDSWTALEKGLETGQVQHSGSLSDKPDIKGGLRADKVSFTYPGQIRKAVEEVSIDLPAGGRLGLIGRSGAGKTTLVKLLSGQLVPESGQILWDAYNLDSVPPTRRWKTLAIASQEDFFFSGTLADNVFIGDNLSHKKNAAHVERALFISGLDLVMEQSGFGWDTQVGERGSALSTGQRQSVSLARALVHDPKILIFDEPTSGVDHMLERRILENLPEWIKGRTFLMITHRTSLLPLVEHLALMENGKIKASGTREEMIKALS